MIKVKCDKCQGKGRIKFKSKLGVNLVGFCSNCNGFGFIRRKSLKELDREFKADQERLNHQCRL